MRQLIIDFDYFKANLLELILIGLIILSGIVASRYITKKLKIKKIRIPKPIIYSILWIFIIILIGLITIPSLSDLIIIENKFLQIKPIGLALISVILFANIFIYKLLKQWLLDTSSVFKKNTFLAFIFVIWSISVYLIFNILAKDFSKISDFELFSVKNTPFTIADLYLVIITLTITGIIIVLLKLSLNRLVKIKKVDASTSMTLLNISKYFIWTIGIVLALQSAGFNLSIILAGSAALLVGIGMGIQQLFNDFASGIILLFERHVKVGDYIQTDEINGRVIEIGFRTTIIITRDNIKIIIPNSKLVSNNVINWTNGEKYARIGLTVGVAYGSDTRKVKDILFNCAVIHPKVLKKPAPEVQFTDFADSSLNFKLYVYTEDTFYSEAIKSDLRFEIYDEFNKYNVAIPFPQMDVHFPENKTNTDKNSS